MELTCSKGKLDMFEYDYLQSISKVMFQSGKNAYEGFRAFRGLPKGGELHPSRLKALQVYCKLYAQAVERCIQPLDGEVARKARDWAKKDREVTETNWTLAYSFCESAFLVGLKYAIEEFSFWTNSPLKFEN